MSWFNGNRKQQVGWGYFRDAFLNADPQQMAQGGLGDFDAYSRWEARQIRYDIYWSMWQSNFFRDQCHFWSPAVKHAFGVYKHTRSIFNPVNRLVEFAVCHIVGGHLDTAAGDGESARSAIPILTEHEPLRKPLAKLWRDSRWQQQKSVWTRYGACLGDAPLIVDDDPERRRVKLRVIHPGHLKWVDRDSAGNVRSYILESWRYDPQSGPAVKDLNPTVDPRGTKVICRYNEEAFVDKGAVTFRTYKNGALYNWRGATEDGAELPAEWAVPYPFVPLVLPPHIDVGLPWGVAEPHGLLSKALEIDDAASGHHDGIRKRIRAPKLLAGIKAPGGPPFDTRGGRDAGEGGVGPDRQDWDAEERQQIPFLYGPKECGVHDLSNDLDTPGINATIAALMAEIERDCPELQMDVFATGDPSGRALRVARQRTENKIQERRSNYDAALVMSHKFAMAIGSIQGYPGYEGLPTDPFEDGVLDHEIGHRPVFSPDPLDDIEEGSAFWAMAGAAVKAGMPLEVFLEREGWSDDEIQAVADSKAATAAEALERAKATAATTVQMPGQPPQPPAPGGPPQQQQPPEPKPPAADETR
jgi:hypothetical protein